MTSLWPSQIITGRGFTAAHKRKDKRREGGKEMLGKSNNDNSNDNNNDSNNDNDNYNDNDNNNNDKDFIIVSITSSNGESPMLIGDT